LSQKVLTDFQAPLELFSLEEEVTLLPGGLFVFALIGVHRGNFGKRSNESLIECARELLGVFYVSSVVSIL
jgi:hypothetical protein